MSEKGEVTMSEYEYLLEMRNIVKSFPGVKALDGAKLLVRPGDGTRLNGGERSGKVHIDEVLIWYLSQR